MIDVEGLTIPSRMRRIVGEIKMLPVGEERYDPKLRRLVDIPARVLEKIDRLQKIAEARLADFLSVYTQSTDSKNSRGWGKIREYKTPGTEFMYYADPIGPDTVVVKKIFRIGQSMGEEKQPDYRYYWVSSEKDDKYHIPFVYIGHLWQKGDGYELKVKPLFMKQRTRGSAVKRSGQLFYCNTNLKATRLEFEIWKQGRPLAQKSTDRSNVRRAPSVGMQPVPVGVHAEEIG